jgi:hypothetical protein
LSYKRSNHISLTPLPLFFKGLAILQIRVFNPLSHSGSTPDDPANGRNRGLSGRVASVGLIVRAVLLSEFVLPFAVSFEGAYGRVG